MSKKNLMRAGLILVLMLSLGAEAKSCKWIDDKGDIHYGDAAPVDQVDKEADCASGAGLKENTNPQDEAKLLAAKKEKEEKRRRANSLRSTYSNEKEIDIALERNTALLSARIEAYDVQLKSALETRDELSGYIAGLRREGKSVPQSAVDDLAMTETRVSRLQSDKARSEEELKAMKARFEEDKILYRKIIVLKPEEAEKSFAKPCNCPVLKDVDAYPDYSSASYRSKKARTRY